MWNAEKKHWLGLLMLLCGLVFGLFQVLKLRLARGDAFPSGSSFRTESTGLRALHDALSEQGRLSVSRQRTRLRASDALLRTTLIVAAVSPQELYDPEFSLAGELPELVQKGLRVVVLLDTEKAIKCSQVRCAGGIGEDDRSEHLGAPPVQAKTRAKAGLKKADAQPSLAERWGFEISGDAERSSSNVRRTGAVPEWVEQPVAWRGQAFFSWKGSNFKQLFEKGGRPVVAKRDFGLGQVVLVASTFPLSNESIAKERSTSFLLWLTGERSRVVFEEMHLGLSEGRGVVSMMRNYGLEGGLYGLLLAGLVYVWYAGSPLIRRAPRKARDRVTASANAAFSALLMRAVPVDSLLDTCLTTYQGFLPRARKTTFAAALPRKARPRFLREPFSQNAVADYNQIVDNLSLQRSALEPKAPAP